MLGSAHVTTRGAQMVRRTAIAALTLALVSVGAPPAHATGVTDGRLVGYQSRDNYVLITQSGARSELPLVHQEPYYDGGHETARAGWHPSGTSLAYDVGDPDTDTERVMVLHADGSRTQLGGVLDRATYAIASPPDFGGDGSYAIAEVSHQIGRRDTRELWRFEGTAPPTLVTVGPFDAWDVRPGSDAIVVADLALTGAPHSFHTVDARTGASTPLAVPLGADQILLDA